jgi:hypothetical protein
MPDSSPFWIASVQLGVMHFHMPFTSVHVAGGMHPWFGVHSGAGGHAGQLPPQSISVSSLSMTLFVQCPGSALVSIVTPSLGSSSLLLPTPLTAQATTLYVAPSSSARALLFWSWVISIGLLPEGSMSSHPAAGSEQSTMTLLLQNPTFSSLYL